MSATHADNLLDTMRELIAGQRSADPDDLALQCAAAVERAGREPVIALQCDDHWYVTAIRVSAGGAPVASFYTTPFKAPDCYADMLNRALARMMGREYEP